MKKLYLFIIINFMTTFAFADVSELNCTELGCGTAFPECEANEFSIKYAGAAEGVTGVDGEPPTEPTSCSYGDSNCVAPENTYTRSDYKFAGWDCKKSDGSSCNQNDGTYQPGDDISRATTTDGDTITLTASWTDSRNFTISYDGKGGSINAELVESCNSKTETFDLPNTEQITRDNSSFLGWKLNGQGDYITTISGADCTEDKNFVADWACDTGYQSSEDGTACVAIEYDIVYELKGGENNTENKKKYKITDSVDLFEPTRANSKFEGWYTEADFTNVIDKIPSGSTDTKVVYAKWSCNDGYAPNADNTGCLGNTITIAYAEGGGAEVSDATCTFGENFIIADATSRTGYTFTGWKLADNDTVVSAGTQIACNDTTLGVFSGTTDKIVAQWTINSYECAAGEYLASGATECSVCEAGSYCVGGTYEYNASAVQGISPCPKDFSTGGAGLTSESSCVGSCTVSCTQKTCPENSIDCVHGNEKATGTMTYGDQECSATAPVCSMTFDCNAGYNKVGDSCVAGNMNAISYDVAGGTINDTKVDSCNVESSTITLPKNVTKTGYTFNGWYDANGEKVEQIEQGTCIGAISLTAQWTANDYLVTYSCGDATVATAPEEKYATYDSEYTVADNTCVNKGYTFTGWAVSDTELGVKPGDKFTWNYATDKTLTAQWTINSYECAAGEYLASGATECSVCEAGSYCAGGTYEYSASAVQGKVTCGANSYSNAGAGLCILCATGYTNSDDHAGRASCKITCPAGEYVAEAGKGCVSVGTGYYGLGGTVGQDETLSRNQCPEGYRDGSAAETESDCMGSCTVACSGNAVCPSNSVNCTHDSSAVSTGTHTYGNQTCNATAVECPVSGFDCAAGYNKEGDSCVVGEMNAISYDVDGGMINDTKVESCNVESATIVLPTNVTKTGHTFNGWYNENGDKVTQIATGTCIDAISLVAQWTACTPCNAGTGASCELSVVNNLCVYTTKCADNYYNEQDAGTPTPSCETCVKSCSGDTNGFVLGEYNVCRNETSGQCYRNCVVGDVSNAYAVSGTITANGNNGCMATSCVSNSYLSGGNCTSCDSGYTAPDNNTGDQSSCTKSCQVTCSGTETCPSNAICEYDTAYQSSGTQVQGGKCSATAVVCPIASFQCESGYRKTSDGNSCERSDYYITYNMDGGQNYAGAPTLYTVGVGTTIEGAPTYAGYVFEGWCLDEGKTNCDNTVVISENAAKDVSVWAKWSMCTNGYYCNGVQNQCPDTHPYSNSGSDTVSDCYAKCEPMPRGDYMINYPVQDTVNHPASCDYNTEVTCMPGYQMVNDKCIACPYDKNAVTYSDGCKIDSCAFGYHPNGSVCDSDIIDCVAPSGLRAQREWDRVKKAYGICKIVECADDHRLVDNVCLPNTEVCTLANGVGIREWDFNKNKWGACIATSCNPGYTNDRSMTNEIWLQCGRCNNAYGKDGKLAVSSYVRECEIASCMYQGELYTLENNECRLICDEYSDETGRRYWDSSRKKCMHECAPGFIKW